MSETTTERPSGEATEAPPPPPEQTPAAEQPPEQQPPPPPSEEQRKEEESRLQRRVAEMRARLSASERERAELAQRMAALEARAQQAQPPAPPLDPQIQTAIDQAAEAKYQARHFEDQRRTFHRAGQEAYPDWQQRMSDLEGMGAVPISSLFLEMPNGVQIAASLRDNATALNEILDQPTQQARAVALGKYAAALAQKPTANISRAPSPPKPITGRVSTAFDPYAPQLSTDSLVDFFSKEAMQKHLERAKGGGVR
jgi:hypothetical protein